MDKMQARDLILMLLDAVGGSINTKTMIQKEIYFVCESIGVDLNFKAHFYGPYSSEVENGLDQLVAAGFVAMQSSNFGVVGNKGFEIKRYDFKIMEEGRQLAGFLRQQDEKTADSIKDFVEKLNQINGIDYISLSAAAKVHFILKREGKPLTDANIKERANLLGWQIETSDIAKAEQILEKLGYLAK